MTKYTINYNTGVTQEVEGTLDDAKAAAKKGASYTQEKITIHDALTGAVVSTARWWGIVPDEDFEDDILLQFGDAGYYSVWEDA